ncbi:MAG TPA: aminotransferase class III-fold pyridoxal phosphate-dependent enzyme, partial [Longimicrobiales bacterium]|nr:aminotransferase class III-fold pyridoxal phosphate-dependent enzyme [Longimicrobiales bacterium]
VRDLRVGSPEMADLPGRGDAAAWSAWAEARLLAADAEVGLGRWNEARGWYRSPLFRAPSDGAPAWRTVHLGVDLFAPAGTPVLAPLAGVVHAVRDNAGELDYGGTVILEHRVRVSGDDAAAGAARSTGDAPPGAPRPDAAVPPGVPPADEAGVLRFWTLYGHLSRASLEALLPGQLVERGERVGALGTPEENGGWAPHLHLQLICDLLDKDGEFAGVCTPAERGVWTSLSPDPTALLLGLSPEEVTPARGEGLSGGEIRRERESRIASSLSVSYRRPLHIVRGWMQHLYDAHGQPYLDAVNNVAHVGHAHPRVSDAIARQARVLNTNTRYLHELLVRYAERLAALFPAPLEVCVFTNSGSEANELALRMARAYTGRRDVVVLEGAYHGNTSSLVDISPYKYGGPGGAGRPEWVHEAALPEPYRGRLGDDASAYALDVGRALSDAEARGGAAAFFFEAMPGCGGQGVPPAGWLPLALAAARRAGAVCVADEVQTGLGRVGSHWWAFEAVAGGDEVVAPDIVTIGKPMGNGHPLGAVVTTREVADAFANGMEYFNTFGGNPVSCAAGLAVLDVIEEEGLRAHAARVGGVLLSGLREVAGRHEVIGDVRGRGLYVGVELVRSRETRSPAGATAAYVAERMRERGVLLSTDGADRNVLKIKPPLPFDAADAERLLQELDTVLGEDPVRALYDDDENR